MNRTALIPAIFRSICAAGAVSLLASACLASAQTTFSPEFFPTLPYLQADFNGDGTPDFLFSNTSAYALLSNGTGGYAKRSYTSATSPGFIASGDFNGDGLNDTFGYGYVAYGDGHGGFPSRKSVTAPPGATLGIIGQTADFNGDGRPDVIVAYPVGGATASSVTVQLYLNNGNGFNAPTTVFNFATPNGVGTQANNAAPVDLVLGDYDADGHADLALRVQATGNNPFAGNVTLTVLYGDGLGHFTPKTVFSQRPGYFPIAAADINDDSRTDLVSTDTDGIHIFYSHPGRMFSETTITTPNVLTYAPVLADFDGNGLKDIGFAAGNYPTDQTVGFNALYQRTPGVFALGQYKSVDTFNGQSGQFALTETLLGDYNHDGKPDAGLALQTEQNHPNSLALLLNTGSRAVGACRAPALGIHVCSPAATSPGQVRFSFSATSFYPVRKMEVFVDGVKRSETYHVFANEGFAELTLSLTPGGHRIGLYSGGYDGHVVRTTFNIQVQ